MKTFSLTRIHETLSLAYESTVK